MLQNSRELVRRPQPEKDAFVKDFLVQNCDVMQIIWDNGYVIRDITLWNYLIAKGLPDIKWVLADFGAVMTIRNAKHYLNSGDLEDAKHVVHYGSNYSPLDWGILSSPPQLEEQHKKWYKKKTKMIRRLKNNLQSAEVIDVIKAATALYSLLNPGEIQM
eukprot:959407_1